MTIREFLSAANESIMVRIQVECEVICAFDSAYWSCLTDSILDCEFHDFTARSVLNRKPEVTINITEEADPDNPDEEEPDEEEP